MEGPPPPRDANVRNIVDKLAEFVARNGPEFEIITKQKQQGNPKFEFLYGGEYAAYYRYRVATEQAFLKQQGSIPKESNISSHGKQNAPAYTQPVPVQHKHQGVGVLDGVGGIGVGANGAGGDAGCAQNYGAMLQQPPLHLWNSSSKLKVPLAQNNSNNALTINLTAQIEGINMQQNTLREQIRQSESNLAAQHSALMVQQNKQIDESIEEAQNALLEKQAQELDICLSDLDAILQPITESCTKDSISAVASSEQRTKLSKLLQLWESKAKFFDACVISKLQTPDSSMKEHRTNLINQHSDILAKFSQITQSTFENYQKQHQIFIQHATQQIAHLEQQKQHIEQQMFATVLPNAQIIQPPAIIGTTQQQPQPQTTMTQQPPPSLSQQPQQIPSLMSQKITHPTEGDLQQLSGPPPPPPTHLHQSPVSSMTNINIMPGIMDNDNNTFNNNNNNNNNNNSSITAINNNNINNVLSQQQTQFKTSSDNSSVVTNASAIVAAGGGINQNFFIPDLSKPPPGFGAGAPHMPTVGAQKFVGQMSNNNITSAGGNINAPMSSIDIANLNPSAVMHLAQQQQQQHFQQHQQQLQMQQQQQCMIPILQYPHLGQQRQQQQPTQILQQQQPQLELQQINNDDLPAAASKQNMLECTKPSARYYDLPAGIMVPLIRLEDYSYRPLDPEDMRLPPPAPQTERLTTALSNFYAPPTHDRPRDTDGWEKLGLYEYYKVKNAARKQKEEEIRSGVRQKSRSPTPVVIEKPKKKKLPKKRAYRSRSRSIERFRAHSRSKSRSPKSRSRSPAYRGRTSPSARVRNSRNNSNNNNNRYARSPTYRERESSIGSNSSRDSNRTDRSTRRERERSTTPPSFFGNSFARSTDFIEETNKGHQMLMKMGWAGTGTGLGSNNQGIEQPISSGNVRDRNDMYKGVGVNLNDPFENFRKNKGAAFVHRMRARDEKS